MSFYETVLELMKCFISNRRMCFRCFGNGSNNDYDDDAMMMTTTTMVMMIMAKTKEESMALCFPSHQPYTVEKEIIWWVIV